MRMVVRQIKLFSASVAVLVCAAGFLSLGAQSAGAQGRTLTGRVTDARSALPIANALLEVEGTRLGTVTDGDGRFRLVNLPSDSLTVIVRRIGYGAFRKAISVASGRATLEVVLRPEAVSLDQIVVTGTAGGEELRSIGNSVATIHAADAMTIANIPDLGSLLNARAPGVVLGQVTGRLGAGPSISIRGRSSLGLGNAPLLYVDGIRVNNATGLGAANGGNGASGSSVSGRLNDINPEDIESIEIIKGPAAATIYGTEASNGVIQVITKRGARGAQTRFSMQAQNGTLWLRDARDRVPTNYAKDSTGAIIPWNAVDQEDARGTPLFTTGHAQNYSGSLSGGQDALRFYASTAYDHETGVEPNNYLQQFTLHANLDVAATPKIDFGTSLNFVDHRAHLGTDAGVSAMLGADVGHILLQPKARGFGLGYPPELSWQLYDNSEDVDRFTAGATLNYRPTTWLSQRLITGLDYAGGDNRALERFATPDLSPFLTPTQATGRLGQTLRRDIGVTIDYSGTAKASLTSAVTSASSIGFQVARTESNASSLGGSGFPAPGVETISSASTALPQTQTELLNTTVGAYAQEKFGWRDRVYVTGAVRVDNNSAFGEDFKWVTYPKADISWVVNDEPFWRWTEMIPTLRLRAAYGESGRAPTAFSALRTFTPVQGPNGTNAVTPGALGNPDLRPERGKEFETGFEMSIRQRLNIDFTYFSKNTIDEIVNQTVSPSSGFPGTIPLNLGRVTNHGFELQTSFAALTHSSYQWDIGGNLATSKDVVEDLGLAPSAITAAGAANRIGYPIGGIWSKRVVSADFNAATKTVANVLCDAGPTITAVACAQAPFVYLGTTTPKLTGAFTNTVLIANRVRLYALVDFQQGQIRLDRDALLRCTGAAGAQLCEANYYPERFSPTYVAEVVGTASAQNIVDQYYNDASFVKLRELSAGLILPRSWIAGAADASFTIAARELATWTKFKGTDPENSSQAVLPPLSRLTATLNIRF